MTRHRYFHWKLSTTAWRQFSLQKLSLSPVMTSQNMQYTQKVWPFHTPLKKKYYHKVWPPTGRPVLLRSWGICFWHLENEIKSKKYSIQCHVSSAYKCGSRYSMPVFLLVLRGTTSFLLGFVQGYDICLLFSLLFFSYSFQFSEKLLLNLKNWKWGGNMFLLLWSLMVIWALIGSISKCWKAHIPSHFRAGSLTINFVWLVIHGLY